MNDTPVICTLRLRRQEAGLSQAELASRAGVSRQALSAIEAGRQVPSTTLALQLARALRCGVDDLFRLAGGPVVTPRLAASGREGDRVALGRVDGGLVAHVLRDESQAADGIVLGDGASVELLGEPGGIDDNVLVAGCAPLLGLLANRLGRQYRDARATWIAADSARALDLLGHGLVHVGGLHLADGRDPDAHVRAAQRIFPGQRATLINLARWRQGLVVAAGNPLGITAGGELARQGLRLAVRAPGSGAQNLLERVFREAGGPASVLGAGAVLASDHFEVAQLVRWGVVDVGVAIESVAVAEGLDFIPLSEERFDLVVPESRLDEPSITRFLDLIDRPAFRAEASGLRGYDLSLAGTASTVACP